MPMSRASGRRARRVRRTACAAVLLGLAAAGQAAAQATPAQPGGLAIRLAVPDGTPEGAGVYVAGTFNDWNPGADGWRLVREGALYSITLPDSVRGPIEFKFTLGSWDRVELTASGGDVPNRTFTVPPTGAITWTGAVGAWRSGPAAPRAHSATASVSVLSDSFAIPQLGRTRRVWLYLPPDYATSQRRYPVLYLQDGQNVFDAATSFAGEWGVDETLDSLHAAGDPGVIVVGVDNGGPRRMNEYMPWPSANRRLGGGEGGAYVDFLARTLKPWVDAHYRTRPDRASTGVGGSSLGGLISVYAALRYPAVFGRVLAFSTPFYINPEIFALARALRPRRPAARFYLDTGLNEGVTAPDTNRAMARTQGAMVDTLAAAGADTARDVRALLPADGAHAEWFWRREFPAAYRWLFAPAGRGPR
jgi:metallo-beta-lactamase class B